MLTPVPQQDTGNLDQPQIVGGLFIVTHQNRPALRKPAQRALNHPTPRRITFLAHLIELLFADAPDMWDVIAFFHEFSTRLLVNSLCPGTGSEVHSSRRVVGARPRWHRAWLPGA